MASPSRWRARENGSPKELDHPVEPPSSTADPATDRGGDGGAPTGDGDAVDSRGGTMDGVALVKVRGSSEAMEVARFGAQCRRLPGSWEEISNLGALRLLLCDSPRYSRGSGQSQ
jgi:hypothetical protein